MLFSEFCMLVRYPFNINNYEDIEELEELPLNRLGVEIPKCIQSKTEIKKSIIHRVEYEKQEPISRLVMVYNLVIYSWLVVSNGTYR